MIGRRTLPLATALVLGIGLIKLRLARGAGRLPTQNGSAMRCGDATGPLSGAG
jgi:hypothetical protein